MTVGVAWEQLGSQAGEDALRRLINESPQDFFGDVARRNIHWFDAHAQQWVNFDLTVTVLGGLCCQYRRGRSPRVRSGTKTKTPGVSVLDESQTPYLRWFVGAQTNASFNEIDRHILQGRGSNTASNLRRRSLGPLKK